LAGSASLSKRAEPSGDAHQLKKGGKGKEGLMEAADNVFGGKNVVPMV